MARSSILAHSTGLARSSSLAVSEVLARSVRLRYFGTFAVLWPALPIWHARTSWPALAQWYSQTGWLALPWLAHSSIMAPVRPLVLSDPVTRSDTVVLSAAFGSLIEFGALMSRGSLASLWCIRTDSPPFHGAASGARSLQPI